MTPKTYSEMDNLRNEIKTVTDEEVFHEMMEVQYRHATDPNWGETDAEEWDIIKAELLSRLTRLRIKNERMREALKQCSAAFSSISLDFNDPRDAVDAGQRIIKSALAPEEKEEA